MKKRMIALLLAIVCVAGFSTSAFARTSTLIDKAYLTVTANGQGKVTVSYVVRGADTVDSIGVQNIYIYQMVGSSYRLVKSYYESDTGMYKHNASSYSNTKTYYGTGTAGTQYKVTMIAFAEEAGERVTSSKTSYATAIN